MSDTDIEAITDAGTTAGTTRRTGIGIQEDTYALETILTTCQAISIGIGQVIGIIIAVGITDIVAIGDIAVITNHPAGPTVGKEWCLRFSGLRRSSNGSNAAASYSAND